MPDPRAWFRRIVSWAQSDFLADSESESAREGWLSHRGEFHAAGWGAAAALMALATNDVRYLAMGVGWVFTRGADGNIPERIPYGSQLKKEPLYVAGHAVAVYAVGKMALWVVAWL